jgi:hypothetical protein
MTAPSDVDVIVSATNDEATGSYVDWSAIVGGVVLASAISILLLTFGSAVGLSFTNFNARPDVSPIWLGIAAASWLLWVQVSSFMAGGYLTGRMRKRHNDATEDEVDVRDGAHGLLVWAGALIVGAFLAASGIGAVANVVGSTAATLTNAASNVAGDAAEALDPNAYFVDMLFRPAAEQPAATVAPSASTPPATTSADSEALRGETARIFARAATGELPEADRTYLGQLVAQQTGLPSDQANARVDEVVAAMDTAKAAAAQAAETARKTTVIGAFLIAASFLVSAIGAYWAAQKGGQHRDQGTELGNWFRRF